VPEPKLRPTAAWTWANRNGDPAVDVRIDRRRLNSDGTIPDDLLAEIREAVRDVAVPGNVVHLAGRT
jgi:hypothetical protein